LLDLLISHHRLIASPSPAARYRPYTVSTPSRASPSPSHHSFVVVVVIIMPTSLVSIKPLPEGDRLKGSSNWAPWYMQMKAMLRRMRCLAHADGTLKCPDPTKAPGDTKPVGDAKGPPPVNQDAIDAWTDLDQEGLCLVQLSIAPSLLWRNQGCTTLFQAWKKLHQAYQPNNRAS
jgi:hypothetical protein